MSRSCQSATFSIAAIALPRSSRARPTTCSHPIGLRLWGIADEPFWPVSNGSSTSPISVFCRPRISSANFSSEAAVMARVDSSSAWRSRWMICDDTGAGSRPSRAHTAASMDGSRCANVPTAPDSLPTLIAGARPLHALDVPLVLRVPERELQAERDRLGVDAVRPADHRRVAVLLGPRADGVAQRRQPVEDEVARLAHLERLRRVDDVRRGQAEVEPAGLLADVLGHGGREGDDVVPGLRLDLLDARDVEGAALADRARPRTPG